MNKLPNSIEQLTDPEIIQGGMGVRISSPELAGAVARNGGLGFISGTALDVVLARSLQEGDKDEVIRTILATFPDQQAVHRVLEHYFIPGGVEYNNQGVKYLKTPKHSKDTEHLGRDLTVLGTFVEVTRAKQLSGGNGYIGMNLLTKIERPIVHALYGAMLAGVDYVEMGAGVPKDVPEMIDKLSRHEAVRYPIKVAKANEQHYVDFDPTVYGATHLELQKPKFLAVVAKEDLAKHLADQPYAPYGFIIENYSAGGHNAPPRGSAKDTKGQPIYSKDDIANIDEFKNIGLPFWLAGGFGGRMGLFNALSTGANGVQIGSVFALSQESGLRQDLKEAIVKKIFSDGLEILKDAKASPTGFPFNVVVFPDTIADSATYDARRRVCDIGHLSETYVNKSGNLIARCPAEPESSWIRNEGLAFRLGGVACLCNSLMATAGFAQIRNGIAEAPLVTLGDNVVKEALEHGQPLTATRIMNNINLATKLAIKSCQR